MTAFAHADVFWEALPAARRGAKSPELETRLACQLAEAEARWPEVAVDGRRFVTHWAAQLARASDVGAAIEQLHLADLYLAFACAERRHSARCALRDAPLVRGRGGAKRGRSAFLRR